MFSNRPVWWRLPKAVTAGGMARQILVVTEIEGTLLEAGAHSLLRQRAGFDFLEAHDIPLVVHSRRTRAEIERLRQTLDLRTPFISEHGSALSLPRGSFPFVPDKAHRSLGGEVIEFGKRYAEVVDAMRLAVYESGVQVVDFSDLTIDEVARELGISKVEAQLVKIRNYSELFRLIDDNEAALSRVTAALRRRGLRAVRQGRYHLVSATLDSGEGLRTLRGLWRLAWGDPVVVGIGESEDDVAWLQQVDIAVIVQNDQALVPARALAKLPTAHVSRWSGRYGWSEAIFEHVGALVAPRRESTAPRAGWKV
jgi:mannosyl-3-phosphoglycerate phosphatase